MVSEIYDHYEQIKFIDYNRRLNIFISYSLDGYINIYLYPSCKLVNVICVKKFEIIFDKVLLFSYPFPIIFCCNQNFFYLFNINGDLIQQTKLDKNDEVKICIDKNCGLVKDFITKNGEKISLPLYEKNNNLY